MKITTARQLKRALTGKNALYSFGVFLVTLYPIGAAALIALFPDEPSTAGLKRATLFALVFGICIIAVLGKRRRTARASMRHLKAYGGVDEAIADLGSPNALVISEAIARSEEKSLDNVLGERFLFAFTAGLVIHFYQIKALEVRRETEDISTLFVTDAKGKSFPFVRRSQDKREDIDRCIEHIKKHYPGCPQVAVSE